MRNFLIALVVFVIWTFFALWLYSLIKSPDSFAWSNTDSTQITTTPTEQNPIITDTLSTKADTVAVLDSLIDKQEPKTGLVGKTAQGEAVFYFQEGLAFKKNDSIVQTTTANLDYKYKVLNYLVEHPDKEVVVVSKYSPNEAINTPNFGVIRGEFIKEQLVDVGIARSKIVVKSEIQDIEFDSTSTCDSGIEFKFAPLNLERLEALKNALPETQIVYPNYTSSGIGANQQLKDVLDLIKRTLEQRPETTIKIIGHTDNIGNYQDNYNTGLKHARQVRWYLIAKGNLDRKIITALSKGESEPIDSNNSERGRNANRRIEVIFN